MSRQPSSETRALVLGRDEHRCQLCETYLRPGQWPGVSIHHRLLRSQGAGCAELHEASNLVSLCGTGTTGCHGWVHSHIERAKALGYLIPATDPRPPHEAPVYTSRHGWQLLDTDGQATPCPPPDRQPRRIPDPKEG
ncbi:HNH endonuclease [Bifidobacterium parmae]|uniref:Leucyl-tRNA synthetase n=1 Tax=Bifidobacterium parmae TaxID=361854 RepID=A0A2N5IVM5_9BIFI|nr:hypothetical protein [Bifidobacterium parmae]PLS26010.1 leucyl-tRNA synthetase [Bifidobacterium parmae]